MEEDSFMYRPLHSWGKSLKFLLDRKLGEPQRWSAYNEEKSPSLPGIDPS
jgi:hypothetical protein